MRISGIGAGTLRPDIVGVFCFREFTVMEDIVHAHHRPTALCVIVVFLTFDARPFDEGDTRECFPVARIITSNYFTVRLVPRLPSLRINV